MENVRNDFLSANVGLDPFGLDMTVHRPSPNSKAANHAIGSEPVLSGTASAFMILGLPIIAAGVMLASAVVLGCVTG